jgi:Zn-dependent protease with chaperone function
MDNEISQKVTAKQKITRLLALFGIYFAIPIFAYVVVLGVQVYEYEFTYQLALSKKFQEMGADPPKEIPSLREICGETGKDQLERLRPVEFFRGGGTMPIFYISEFSQPLVFKVKQNLQDLCSSYNWAALVKNASLTSGGLTLVLLIGIAISGWAARKNRFLLLFIFRPGMIVTLCSVVILLVLNTTLALISLLYFRIFFIPPMGIIPYFVILGLGLLALGILIIIRTIGTSIGILKIPVGIDTVGKPLEKDRHGALWGEIEGVAQQVGTAVPDHVTAGLRPEFFVTEEEIQSLDGKLTGRTMYLSLPFLRILSSEEVRGIIGHELAHFKGLDTRFSRKFNPFYRRAIDSYHAMVAGQTQDIGYFTLFPAILLFSFFLWSFEVAAGKISRERELVADEVGAAVSGKKGKASGLVKHIAFMPSYYEVMQSVYESLADGERCDNMSAMFGEYANRSADESILGGLDQEVIPHPTDTHPPLRARLEALGLSVNDVRKEALALFHESNWIRLIDDFEGLEKELTDTGQSWLLESGAVDMYKKTRKWEPVDSGEVQHETPEAE